jgi:sugar phosphate isomerase/epimerase
MEIGLSTHWNAGRHTDGEAMITEILEMGIGQVELGYDLRMDLVPGVKKMVESGAVKVHSVHNFCPVPVGAPQGHPELFTFSSSDRRVRESAVEHTSRTIRFAAEVGAKVIVSHSGNVEMKRMSSTLVDMLERDMMFHPKYEKAKLKLQLTREKKMRKQIGFLYENVERLLPLLDEYEVYLGLENLPTWEAIPTEYEMFDLLKHFSSSRLRYWHDMGHGQIRENMGLVNVERWLEKLQPYLAGMHVHDVARPACDHVMPPHGSMDFTLFKRFAELDIVRVIEPRPGAVKEDVVGAHKFLMETWASTPSAESEEVS